MNYNFRNVILLTDFTETSRNAIRYSIKALGEQPQYLLLNTYLLKTTASTFRDLNELAGKESIARLEEEMQGIRDEFPQLDLKLNLCSKFGATEEVLRRYLKQGFTDLVVMGNNLEKEAIFSSSHVLAKVLSDVYVPTLVVPDCSDFSKLRRVHIGNDIKAICKKTNLAVLKSLQQNFQCQITGLSVKPTGWKPDSHEFNLYRYLESRDFIEEVKIIENEQVGQSLTSVCRDDASDMLILISKNKGFFQRVFSRNLCHDVVSKACFPILALP